MPKHTFDGTELRRRRIAAGQSAAYLAARVGRSVDAIWFYERGEVDPPTSILLAICDELGCSPSDLTIEAVAS